MNFKEIIKPYQEAVRAIYPNRPIRFFLIWVAVVVLILRLVDLAIGDIAVDMIVQTHSIQYTQQEIIKLQELSKSWVIDVLFGLFFGSVVIFLVEFGRGTFLRNLKTELNELFEYMFGGAVTFVLVLFVVYQFPEIPEWSRLSSINTVITIASIGYCFYVFSYTARKIKAIFRSDTD